MTAGLAPRNFVTATRFQTALRVLQTAAPMRPPLRCMPAAMRGLAIIVVPRAPRGSAADFHHRLADLLPRLDALVSDVHVVERVALGDLDCELARDHRRED